MTETAAKAGLHFNTMRNICKGRTRPSARVFEKLRDLLPELLDSTHSPHE